MLTRLAAAAATLLVLAALSMLVGCESDQSAAVKPASGIYGDWVLTEVDGQAVPAVAGITSPTLTIANDGRVSGSSGVNRISGMTDAARLKEGSVDLSKMMSTRMAGSPEAMQLEARVMDAMARSTSARVDGDGRLVFSNEGKRLLVYRRQQ